MVKLKCGVQNYLWSCYQIRSPVFNTQYVTGLHIKYTNISGDAAFLELQRQGKTEVFGKKACPSTTSTSINLTWNGQR